MKLMQQLQLFGKNKNVGGKAQSPCSARRADFGRKRPGCGMRYNASATALIALTVLCLTSCSVSRKASSSERLLRTEATTRDTVWQQVVVAVHDTLREVTTITLRQNDQGDTLKLVQVTDRTRASNREGYRDREVKIVVNSDTVYIE